MCVTGGPRARLGFRDAVGALLITPGVHILNHLRKFGGPDRGNDHKETLIGNASPLTNLDHP